MMSVIKNKRGGHMAKRTTSRGGSRPFTRRQQRARQQRWLIFGVIAVLTLVGAGIAYAYLGQDDDLGEEITDLGNAHLQAAPPNYIWNSRPPTSGPHSPGIANWGEHSETVPEWNQVHNLEDGGVIMHYNCPEGCPEIVEELRDILQDMGSHQLILEPYTEMESRIAVTAWTRLLTMDELDRDLIVDFVEEYRGIDHHR
ncbi:MAG: DUF3105 domain-containing protein [Chloroflexi bacterium]|nr:MAG: DUF3105 domain-containing protein [Chloroflexota bacterium]